MSKIRTKVYDFNKRVQNRATTRQPLQMVYVSWFKAAVEMSSTGIRSELGSVTERPSLTRHEFEW